MPEPTSSRRAMHRILVACLGILLACATMVAMASSGTPQAQAETQTEPTTSAAQSATDFDSWTAVAQSIEEELTAGRDAYAQGERAKAASHFSRALNTGYVASNLAKLVNDTQGADQYQDQLAQLRELTRLAYAEGNEAKIADTIAALGTELTATATTLDQDTAQPNPRDYAAARTAQTQAEREQLDAAKVRVNEGRGDRTWSQVAEEMTQILDQAAATARAGDGEAGAAGVNDAYYQYYEKLGFEKNVMNAIGGSRVSKVEATFKNARKAMVAGDTAAADTYVKDLDAMLAEDAAALDGGATGSANGFTKAVTSAAGQAFLVLLREGLEALLVVAGVVAYLLRSGLRRGVRWVYAGALLGLVASGAVAALFTALFGGSGPQQEIMEGVCALVAAAMLAWSGNWMFSKRSTDSWNSYIRTKTEAAVGAARTTDGVALRAVGSLALLSFLAVFREGAETVIFYESILSMTDDARGMWIGGLLAAVVLAVVFAVIRLTSARLPIGPFFTVTSVLMTALAVIFVGGGVHALIEGDLVDGTYLEGWPTNDWLGVYPYVQTLVAQAVAAVLLIAMFVIAVRAQRRKAAAARSAPADDAPAHDVTAPTPAQAAVPAAE